MNEWVENLFFLCWKMYPLYPYFKCMSCLQNFITFINVNFDNIKDVITVFLFLKSNFWHHCELIRSDGITENGPVDICD